MENEYEKIGNPLKITKSNGNIIEKINHKTIKELYKINFNSNVLNAINVFPILIVKKSKNILLNIVKITENSIETDREISKDELLYFGCDKKNSCMIHFINTQTEHLNKKSARLKELNKLLIEKIEDKVSIICEKEQMLIENAKFATMGEMINMIAHQWRQPLHNLNLELMRIKFANDLGTLDKSIIDDVVKNTNTQVQYMSETIDDFRNFFKKDKDIVNINIDNTIKEALSLIDNIFSKDRVKIEYKNSNKTNIDVFKNELIQVFLNILKNAYDALIDKKIKNKIIKIDVFETENSVYINISDNAGGIKSNILKEIFNPYFSTKGLNGTGIGLYMSKIIIEKHMKGKIYAENINSGAIFKIELNKNFKINNE